MTKAIWWYSGIFYSTKKAVFENHGPDVEPDRLECPYYCNPIQLANFLNKLDPKYINASNQT